MKFTDKDIGSKVLETITSGLYDGNLNCIREYLQNSIDSKAENVKVFFENMNQNLIILDDGSGMSKKDLEEALRIGFSRKSEDDVGWRGIGIWSGVSSCKKIVIITKKKNDKKYRIEIDNEILRSEYGSNKPANETLSKSTGEIEELEPNKDESSEEDHFTKVSLESILPTQKGIFSEINIKKYLFGVVPVPFDKERFSFAEEIENWLKEKGVVLPTIDIELFGKKVNRPPFISDLFFSNVIKKEFKIENDLIAVGWFLVCKDNKEPKRPNRGIYFKKKGFTIGDDNLVRKQFDGTYSQWQYGEIHIVSKELRENAPRNSFEYNSSIVDPFFKAVGKYIEQLQMQNRYQSDRNVSSDIEKAKDYLNKVNIVEAKKLLVKINKRLATPRAFPEDPSLQSMKTVIDNISKKNKTEVAKIEVKIKSLKPEIIRMKKEQLEATVNNLPQPVKESIKRASKKGLLYPEISVTDSIKTILKNKTGLSSNEIFYLSQAAYGWKSVSSSSTHPLLMIDPAEKTATTTKERNYAIKRNRHFGVMILNIHDLFVNLCKHKTGTDSFQWFEGSSEEEKYEILTGMYAVIGLIYKLIEKSVNY